MNPIEKADARTDLVLAKQNSTNGLQQTDYFKNVAR